MIADTLQTMSPEELIATVLRDAGTSACLTCSFQAEDVAVLHLARQVQPDLPVLFLETGYHFPETIAYRDKLAREWNLNLINLESPMPVVEQEQQFGILYQNSPTQCCQIRKVEPLMRGLEPYRVWLTGLRREQSPTRANLQQVEHHKLPTGTTLLKVSPLAAWKWNEVWSYLRIHEIEPLELYDQGYTSIGCAPCTTKPTEEGNARSGRWGGHKLECGIHTFSQKA